MKRYRLTENRLRGIISETIQSVLNEGKATNEIRQAYDLLNNVVNSGFIPFSSPSPSSTEMVIKRSVMNAMDELMTAMDACRDCGY